MKERAASEFASSGPDPDAASAFHPGERSIQERVGVREKIESYGARGIRDYMPDQHRAFFTQLPLFFIGMIGEQGRPWCSVLAGRPGFLHSPEPRRLHVAATPPDGDPLADSLRDGALIGGLGIEFHTRRRNRVNGKVALDRDGMGFTVNVDQSFGNCPQYIQARQFRLPHSRDIASRQPGRRLDRLDASARAIVARADTCFIASHSGDDPSDRRQGVDVSHRGGRPGFALMRDERTILLPDYRGNFFFNTLGNISVNPACGLLFLDFDSGDLLQLTGRGEILWDVPRDEPRLSDAQRVVRFFIDDGVYHGKAVPIVWDFLSHAPQFTNP